MILVTDSAQFVLTGTTEISTVISVAEIRVAAVSAFRVHQRVKKSHA